MPHDKAYTFVAALLRRSKNRTPTNLDHYAKRSIGRPIGSKIMREALCEAKFVRLSERTLFNYFIELEHTAVFHYLMRTNYCKPALKPLDHYDKNFPRKIMQRARSVDNLRGVCLLYNTAVTALNEKYRFDFLLLENVPKPETETKYDALINCERDIDLTKAITAVTGLTA